jgi:hypothetical protein
MTINDFSTQLPTIQSKGLVNVVRFLVILTRKFFNSLYNGSLLRPVNLFVMVLLIITQVIGVPNAYAAPIAASTTTTFIPSADAFVHPTAPNTNYGSLTQIRVDNSPMIRSYLRFNVQGLSEPVTKATLRLYTQSVSNAGYNVYLCPDTGWDEKSINYTNAPALGGLAGSVGAFGADVWTTVDITPSVTGNGTLSLVITDKNDSSINFVSREGGANAPQLVITTGSNSVIVPTIGPSATPVPIIVEANIPISTSIPPTATSTIINTSVPLTATATPTNTVLPTIVATSIPNATSIPPTATATIIKTSVPLTATATPTNTVLPTIVATSIPNATSTPPTATSTAMATNTSVPPTVTPTVSVSTGGKVWYVDNAVSTNGDGTSWAKAWKAFTSIQWSSVQPGDTIYLSGGSSSKTYNEQLAVSKSGTSSARITITGGKDAGHNGQVILDGGETRSYCARTSGDYLTLSGLTCQNSINSGIRIEGTGTILEKSVFSSISGQAIHLYGCDDCVVRGNKITTDDINASQTDGVVVYGNSQRVVIESNWIKLTNQTGTHNDGIQANQDTDLTVRYNYVENTKNSTSDAQGIYATQMYGTIKFYGNVVVIPYGGQAVSNRNLDIGTSHTVVVNNTIKCGGYRCIYVSEDTLPIIKNNLVWQTGTGAVLQIADTYSRGVTLAGIPDANINGNLWYAPGGSGNVFDVFGKKNWSSWQVEGFDTYGKNTDPVVDSCFRPISGSPAINAGQVITNEYGSGLSISLCGTNGSTGLLPVILTDRGTAWNIGAFDSK